MEQICRGCCIDKTNKLISIYDIFERFDRSEKINEMFSEISGFEVAHDDGFPAQLCFQCLDDLSIAYKFRIQCINSHENFKTNFLMNKNSEFVLNNNSYIISTKSNDNLLNSDLNIQENESSHSYIDNEKNSLSDGNEIEYIKTEIFMKDEDLNNITEEIVKTTSEKKKPQNLRKKFNCNSCQLPFPNKKKLLQHIKITHQPKKSPDNNIYCDICNRLFTSIQALSQHLHLHSRNNEIEMSGKKLKCSICSRQFNHEILLNKHIEIFHEEDLKFCDNESKSLICTICQTNCLTKNEYDQHIEACQLHNSDLKCGFCDKSFLSERAFMSHIKHNHNNNNDKNSNELQETFICHICKAKYNYKILLEQHLLLHEKKGEGDNENVPCPFCGKTFRTRVRVNTHIRAIHNKEKRHKCEFCNKEYFYGNALKVHQLRHHYMEANFICNFCGKSFFACGELNVHLRKHNGDSRYKCTMEGCDKLFSQLSELKFHIRSRHTGERDFKCTNCDKTFITKQHLKQHTERNHFDGKRERKYQCTICANSFYTKNVLMKHAFRIHQIKKENIINTI